MLKNLEATITISKALDSYENGNLVYSQKNIELLSKKYPNNTNILYLKGLIEENGKKSYIYFNDIAINHKSSSKYKISKKRTRDYKNILQIIEGKSQKQNSNKIVAIKNKTVYSFQIGAFSSLINAKKYKEKYDKLKPFIRKVKIKNKVYYRVFAGRFDKKEQLLRFKKRIEKYKISSNIKMILN